MKNIHFPIRTCCFILFKRSSFLLSDLVMHLWPHSLAHYTIKEFLTAFHGGPCAFMTSIESNSVITLNLSLIPRIISVIELCHSCQYCHARRQKSTQTSEANNLTALANRLFFTFPIQVTFVILKKCSFVL